MEEWTGGRTSNRTLLRTEYEFRSSHWRLLRCWSSPGGGGECVGITSKNHRLLRLLHFLCWLKETGTENIVNYPDSPKQIQAYLRHISGLLPGHCNEASIAIKWVTHFAGRGSYLQFAKYIPVQHRVKHNKMRHACIEWKSLWELVMVDGEVFQKQVEFQSLLHSHQL